MMGSWVRVPQAAPLPPSNQRPNSPPSRGYVIYRVSSAACPQMDMRRSGQESTLAAWKRLFMSGILWGANSLTPDADAVWALVEAEVAALLFPGERHVCRSEQPPTR